MASNRPVRVLVTTGDADGIGWEVTAKALNRLGPQSGVQFVIYRSDWRPKSAPALSRKFRVRKVEDLQSAGEVDFDPKTCVEIRSTLNPALWVEEAALACHRGDYHALVTAPLSKTLIIEAGLKDIGHTEILSRISGTRDLFMGFVGDKFAVVLATGHQPLSTALREFNAEKLTKALSAARQLRGILPASRRKLPFGLLGINPHAGEGGLIGQDEKWMQDFVSDEVRGPLVPDAAFLPKFWKSYAAYICPYHDQGLIPFKLVHGFAGGVHLTLGLPFVRTSVDHGTAKELFGKNKAESGSMRDALVTAIRLSRPLKENRR